VAGFTAGEFAVGRTMWTRGFWSESFDLVGLIGLEVSFKPEPMGVALPRQDVSGNTIKEPTIVTDDHRTAGEFQQRVFLR